MIIKRTGMPLFCICAPSAVGKTVIASMSKLTEVISHTSRPRRDSEIDGIHYHFTTNVWMNSHKESLFQMDFKPYKEYFYGATDEELLTKDCIVIKLEDALEYAKEGADVRIIIIEGHSREERAGRDLLEEHTEFYAMVKHNLEYIYAKVVNDSTVEEGAEKLNILYNTIQKELNLINK